MVSWLWLKTLHVTWPVVATFKVCHDWTVFQSCWQVTMTKTFTFSTPATVMGRITAGDTRVTATMLQVKGIYCILHACYNQYRFSFCETISPFFPLSVCYWKIQWRELTFMVPVVSLLSAAVTVDTSTCGIRTLLVWFSLWRETGEEW